MIGGDQHRGDRQNHDRELNLGKLKRSHMPSRPPTILSLLKQCPGLQRLTQHTLGVFISKHTFQEQQTKARDGT